MCTDGICYSIHPPYCFVRRSSPLRSMPPTFIIGLIGPVCTHSARKTWNEMFRSRGIDAFFDFYRTKTERDLELRLSEMFLHERRGYIVDARFSHAIIRLLDRLDVRAEESSTVDTVVNEGGVFVGYDTSSTDDQSQMERRISLFFSRTSWA